MNKRGAAFQDPNFGTANCNLPTINMDLDDKFHDLLLKVFEPSLD